MFNYEDTDTCADVFARMDFSATDKFDDLMDVIELRWEKNESHFVYHEGKSEEATRKTLVERHPRDSFTVATKFPTFNLVPEDEIEGIFQDPLDNLGLDYIDYYLIHNIQNV